jgi:hypothetical protein
MTIDRYTKCVLTVIAGCLLWICVMGAGASVAAQPRFTIPKAAVQPVVIVGTGTLDQEGTVTINFTQQVRAKAQTDPTIPVSLPYSTAKPLPVDLPYTTSAPMPIEISAVRKIGEWEPLRARVEDAPTRKLPGGGQ